MTSVTDGGGPADTTYEIDDEEQVSDAVVRAVAAVTGKQPSSLTPIYEVTDPDALDTMFERDSEGVRTDGHLLLRYEGCEVVVDGRTVRIRTE